MDPWGSAVACMKRMELSFREKRLTPLAGWDIMLAMRAAAKLRAQAKFSDMQNQAKIAEDARELERVQREAKEAQQRKELWEADWEKRRTQLLGEEVRRFSQADSQRLLGDDAQTEDTESTLSKATQKWASLVRQLNPDVAEVSARGTGSDWSSFTSQSLNAVLRKYHKKVDDLFSSVRTVDKEDDDSSSDDDSFTARPVPPQLQLKHAPTAPSGLQLSSQGTRKPVMARAEDQSKQLVAAERTCKHLIYLALALQDARSTQEVLARVLAWWPTNMPNKGLLNELELERILTDIAMRPRPGATGRAEAEENGWVLPLEAYADVDEASAEYTGPEREVVSRRKEAAAQELDRLRRRAEEREAEEEDRKRRERERVERQRLESEQAAAEAKRREEEAERLHREMEEKVRREKEAEEKERRRAEEEERRRRDEAAAQRAAREEEDRWRQEQSALAQLEAEEVARRAKEERERRQREDEEAALAKKMARAAAAAAARLAAEQERQQREESRRMAEEEKKRLATRRKQEDEEERLRRAKDKASQPRKRVQEFHGRRVDPDKVRGFICCVRPHTLSHPLPALGVSRCQGA